MSTPAEAWQALADWQPRTLVDLVAAERIAGPVAHPDAHLLHLVDFGAQRDQLRHGAACPAGDVQLEVLDGELRLERRCPGHRARHHGQRAGRKSQQDSGEVPGHCHSHRYRLIRPPYGAERVSVMGSE